MRFALENEYASGLGQLPFDCRHGEAAQRRDPMYLGSQAQARALISKR
jgi:hypothetical protein